MAATLTLLSIAAMENTPQTPGTTDDDKKNFVMKELLFWFYHTYVVVVAALLITFAVRAQQEVLAIPATDSYARAMETITFWGKGSNES